jgi:UDP-N-acetylmuramoyl-L-alanyl-D-glutamate--2,6-diaminopimelate ligase
LSSDPQPKKMLGELLEGAGLQPRGLIEPVYVTGIKADSRKVQPGDLFVAWAGASQDGHRFIDDALERGAVAIVGTRDISGLDKPYLKVGDSQAALASLSASLYDFPARKLMVIGVTGTDGKTTTTNLIHRLLRHSELKAGMISTVNAVIGSQVIDTGFHVTTPDAPDVQQFFARMVREGLTHVVLEATSHGLDQHRVDGCEFDIAVVTNITHEHLDYHGNYANYLAAKARLFTSLASTSPKPFGNLRLAVLNRDDQSYTQLAALAGTNQISYGLSPEADIRAENIEALPDGLHFVVRGNGYRISMSTRLAGYFNIYNCLAAVAVGVRGLGLDLETVREGVALLDGVPGRMERIDMNQAFTAVVDFAHTPNALRRALETARQMVSGRVIVVFGSAGLRDRQKRRLMAEVAAELADFTVLTAEDPRTESLDEILGEMADGMVSRGSREGQGFIRVADRGQAIREAVACARESDVVIVCGKGHEQSMCFGEIEYAWDDRTALRAALAGRLGIPGPEMPYLPTQEYDAPVDR